MRTWSMWVLVLVLLSSACGGPTAEPAVLSVSIEEGGRSVAVGGTLMLSASVESVGGASQAVSWVSATPSVATVDGLGLVSGLAVGQTQVTATSDFDPSRSATVVVDVVEPSAVLSVTINEPSRVVVVGGDTQYTVTVVAIGGADEALAWRSTQPEVATVDANGLVTAHAAGQTGVFATSVFDPTKGSGVTVTVVAPDTSTAMNARQAARP